MNTTLWIFQGILAILFATAGVMKITQPIQRLVNSVNWVDRFPVEAVKVIGFSELIGAIGLVLPWALNIVPVLTPGAATALATVQFLAIFHHSRYREGKAIAFNIVLCLMAVFVAIGRFVSVYGQ